MVVALGIDPGYGVCGYAVVGLETSVHWGYVSTEPSLPFPQRLVELKNDISTLLKDFQPDIVGIEEDMFLQRNTNASTVMQAYGVIRCTIAEFSIPEITFTPLEVKEAVCHSKATKSQMKEAVRLMFGIKEKFKKDDCADAIAVAYKAHCCFCTEIRAV